MAPTAQGTSARPGVSRHFLGALRSGALVGLPIGLVLGVVVLVADDTDVTFVAYAISLGIAAVGLGIGLILWFAALVGSRIVARVTRIDAPLGREAMRLDRLVLGLGAAGAVACAPVAVAALVTGETLF